MWDVKESPGADKYGSNMKYDIVYDDGDTESNVDEIWVAKKVDYETCLQNPEEKDWIGVRNICFLDSKDEYARLVGWYETCLEGVPEVHSSLREAFRANDKHIIKMRGKGKILATELNFPAEHFGSLK